MFASKNFFITKNPGGGSYLVIEQFLASGSWKAPAGVTAVDYLVVAGGGSGAYGGSGGNGGGGAGGFLTGTALSVTAGTTYTVTVGAGGAAVVSGPANGNNGSNSVFSSLTAIGGGPFVISTVPNEPSPIFFVPGFVVSFQS
jgi:hypothetical protein